MYKRQVVEWLLAYVVGHGDGEFAARVYVAEKCSNQRRTRLHSGEPCLQNRRDVIRGPRKGEWAAAEYNQDHGLAGRDDCLQKLLLISGQAEMGAGCAFGAHPQGVFSESH